MKGRKAEGAPVHAPICALLLSVASKCSMWTQPPTTAEWNTRGQALIQFFIKSGGELTRFLSGKGANFLPLGGHAPQRSRDDQAG